MSYIGNKPATAFETVQKQISTSNSGTTITLDRAVTSVQDILLTIDAVVQSYDNYSVSGTTLTVGGTLSNNRVEILYVGRTMQSVDPTDDSVSASKIKTDAVTTAKVQNDAITVDKLNLISTSSVPSLEAKGTSGVTEGYIQLNCAENSHGIKIKSAPHSANANYTLVLPNNDGDANQFLQTNGSGVLSFADAGGTFVQTARTVISGGNPASVDVNNCFNSTYDTYMIVIDKVEMTVDSQRISCRLRDSGGSVTGSNYRYASRLFTDDGTTQNVNANSPDSKFDITNETDNSSSNGGLHGIMYVFRPHNSSEQTRMQIYQSFIEPSDMRVGIGACTYEVAGTHTGIGFNITAGGMRDGGSFTVYGIAYS